MILLPLILSLAAQWTQPAPPKNVLVIVFDDMGVEDTASMDTLQEFANGGLAFTRAYSYPVCSSTRLAAMCGTLPRRHGLGDIVNTYFPNLSPSPYPPCSLLTIAESLKARGFRTGLFGKYHLGRCGNLVGPGLFNVEASAFVQGWDTVRAMNPDSIAFGPGTSYTYWDRLNDGARGIETTYATDLQADKFIEWWTSTHGAKLGWLAFNAAHAPYDPPPGYPPGGSGDTRTDYLNILDHADTRLSDVLAAVDETSTWVFIFGDNGTPDAARPAGSASGIWKGTTREGGVRVPLFVQGPGISSAMSDRLVSLVDLPATICDVLNITWKGGQDGMSMFAPEERTWLLTERWKDDLDDLAIIESDWKLRVFDADGPGPLLSVEETYRILAPGIETPDVPSQADLDRLHTHLASLPPRQ